MTLPLPVVERVRDILQSEFFLYKPQNIHVLMDGWDKPKRILPYDLLRLAQVNRTFYRVFMSDVAWAPFGSGQGISKRYLELKPKVSRDLWTHELLWSTALNRDLHEPEKNDIKQWPIVFRALLQALSRHAIYEWSRARDLPPGSALVDKDYYRIWQSNSHPQLPRLVYFYIPQSLRDPEFILELLSLGMHQSGLDPSYETIEGMQACLKYRYFEQGGGEQFDHLFVDFIFEDPELARRRIASNPGILQLVPRENIMDEEFMNRALEGHSLAYFYAPPEMRLSRRFALRALNAACAAGDIEIFLYLDLIHEQLDAMNRGDPEALKLLDQAVRNSQY